MTWSHRSLNFLAYLSAAMMPAMVTAPIIPMSLYLNMVLESCFRTTKCMSSCEETKMEKNEDVGMTKEPINIGAEKPRIARFYHLLTVSFGKSFHLSESQYFSPIKMEKVLKGSETNYEKF